MKMRMNFFAIVIAFATQVAFATQPDPGKTPGVLCTKTDPNYSEDRYAEKIPVCKRNVSKDEKRRVAQEYGNIPESDWPKYEFDHLIPLSVGGSDDIGNIWPQPIAEAKQKDVLENQIFNDISQGKITQAEAVQKVHEWIQTH